MVGNTMIDTLVVRMQPRISAIDAPGRLGLERGAYLVVTLHRPTLVDGPLLADAMEALLRVAEELAVVFPVHPRTRAALDALGIAPPPDGRLLLLEPLGYLEFMSLVEGSAGVLTDSGGIQEETTFLGIPCFTLRTNTERPITCDRDEHAARPRPRADRRGARAAGSGRLRSGASRTTGTGRRRGGSSTSSPGCPAVSAARR